jgi:hypothetical protein
VEVLKSVEAVEEARQHGEVTVEVLKSVEGAVEGRKNEEAIEGDLQHAEAIGEVLRLVEDMRSVQGQVEKENCERATEEGRTSVEGAEQAECLATNFVTSDWAVEVVQQSEWVVQVLQSEAEVGEDHLSVEEVEEDHPSVERAKQAECLATNFVTCGWAVEVVRQLQIEGEVVEVR